jgi:hypothetical protein
MAAKPKAKPSPAPTSVARADRTSAVVTTTLILLTALGIVTIFWEPLTALAVGTPPTESVSEARTAAPDGGAAAVPAAALSTSGVVDASGSS